MGIYFTKKMLLVLTPILLLHLFISSSYGTRLLRCDFSDGKCKFLPFSGPFFNSDEPGEGIPKEIRSQPEGNTPESANLDELKNLNLCKMFRGKEIFSDSQFNSIASSLQSLTTSGEAVTDCMYLYWDLLVLLECSISHPHVGPLRISTYFCDRVFEACSEAYFSSDVTNQVIVPCGASKGIICGKASKWEFNGTTFCHALGFTVQEADDSV